MKRITQGCLAIIITITSASAAPVIEKPAVLPDAMLSVTVPDLHGFIDGVGTVAAQSSPMMNGMMLKSLIGMQLGDPNLTGIPPGKGLSIIALDATNIFAVAEVAEAQSAAYLNAAANKSLQADYAGGLMVLGKSPEMIAKGKSMAAKVQSILLAKRSPTLRIAMQPAAVIDQHNEAIENFMKTFPATMGVAMQQVPGSDEKATQSMLKLLEGELRVLLSIARQCETAEAVVAPDKGGIRVSESFVPKAGTPLAALINSPKTGKPNPAVQSGVLGDGMVLFDFQMGTADAFASFVTAETDQLVKEMEFKDVDVNKLGEIMVKWMGLYSGSGCETFDFDPDSGMQINYLMEVSDQKAAVDMLKTMQADMAPFMKLYEDLGMPMSFAFKENAREYKGIQIHRLDVNFSMEGMIPQQRDQLKAMKLEKMGYDIALFDGLMLYTMGAGTIESIIDKIQSKAGPVEPLQARSVYPAGGFYYCDLDVGRYVEFAASLAPAGSPNPFSPQVIAMMQGVDSITSAGFRQNGVVMWSLNIPGDLIGKLGQIGMMMQMQQMQQQQVIPGGMPGAIPGGMPQEMPQSIPQSIPLQ